MEINLNKKSETSYYYSKDGLTFGPFLIHELIDKIDAETLVYREGIEWTNANNIEELNIYFKNKKLNENNSTAVVKKQDANKINKVDMFVMSKSFFFESYQLPLIREKLLSISDGKWSIIQITSFKNPQTALVLSIIFGFYGIDRFYIGNIGLGVLKLFTCGGLGIWTIVDWFIIQKATRQKNYSKIITML
jgi:TM2 domain-containing membrane protein YozV